MSIAEQIPADPSGSGRAALVTGGSSGIGLAIARALAGEGYALTVAARGRERLEGAVAALRGDGIAVRGTVADVSRESDVVRLLAGHREEWGRLDVLVNSAAVGALGRVDSLDAAQVDEQLAVNVRGLAIVTREALPLLRAAAAEHGKALIVNLASLAGTTGQASASIYAATKAAVLNFTESTHREVGAEGIQCTALAPSFVDTPMTEFLRGHVPAAEMLPADDVGEAVRFLLRTSPNCHVPLLTMTRRAEASPAAL